MGWHLYPSDHRKWAVRTSGAGRASRLFADQELGRQYAEQRAGADRDVLYVHHSDGRIAQRIDLSGNQAG